MKALSLWQPWASLMADGRKPWETRHWPAPASLIGKEYVIHAAMKVDRAACERFGYDWRSIPRGQVLSTHILRECRQFTEQNILDIEDEYGNFAPLRYGWHSPLARRFQRPETAVGHQGLWNWLPPWEN